MSAHISEELPRLLTGDAARDVVMAAAEHLRTCPDCQQELVSAVVAHASLTSAHRFAPEVVAPESTETHEDDSEPAGPLPDLSPVFAHAHEDATTRAAAKPQRRRRLIAVAAAAVVLAGGGVTIAETVGSGPSSVQRTVALRPFDIGTHSATATIASGSMKINATSLPKLDGRHRYEVWLTDQSRSRMQSVGYIGDAKTAMLNVPANVMSQYNDIEVSLQKINQAKYSGTSVLRGAYG